MSDVYVKSIESKLNQCEQTIKDVIQIVNSDFNYATESKKQLRGKMDKIINTLNTHNDKINL